MCIVRRYVRTMDDQDGMNAEDVMGVANSICCEVHTTEIGFVNGALLAEKARRWWWRRWRRRRR